MVYTLLFFLSSKCSLFHNSNVFGSCIIHILYTGVLKLKNNNNSGAKKFNNYALRSIPEKRGSHQPGRLKVGGGWIEFEWVGDCWNDIDRGETPISLD